MRFGFGRGSKAKVAADGEVEAEAIREAIKSAATKQASESRPEQQDGRQLGILILPGTRDVMEFWTLYKSIQKSGIPNHVGIFNKAHGVWSEEQSPE